jgi:hypothetical protein
MLLFTASQGSLHKLIRKTPVNPTLAGWEQSVGAVGPALWPLYVHEGTGLYKRRGVKSFITARHDRGPASVLSTRRARLTENGVMRFRGRDGKIYYRRRTAGQHPNPYVEQAFLVTSLYARGKTFNLGKHIIHG